jgi:SAM-dependent methyltransferase
MTDGHPTTDTEPARAAGRPAAASSEAVALARLYDVDASEDPGDLDLYRALAARTGGPILELAVGSGRLAVPLAADGFHVTGVDRDPAMLARARAAATRAGLWPAGIALVAADVRGLILPDAGTYRLAIIALNSLLLLGRRDEQRAAIATLAHHLAPGGVAVVDVWQPDADDLARFDGRLILEYAGRPGEGGRSVTKVASATHDPSSQVVELTAIYDEGRPGEPARRWTRTDRLRLVSADELRGFAEDAGLMVDVVAGGYDLEPTGPAAERAILVANRP